jgi:hypothetical protein
MNNYELMNRLVNVSNSHKNKKVIKGLLLLGSVTTVIAIYYFNKNKENTYLYSRQIKLYEALKAKNEELKNIAVGLKNVPNNLDEEALTIVKDQLG